jgi:hypothetical protein
MVLVTIACPISMEAKYHFTILRSRCAILCEQRSFDPPAALDPPAPTLRPHPVFDHLLSKALGYGPRGYVPQTCL